MWPQHIFYSHTVAPREWFLGHPCIRRYNINQESYRQRFRCSKSKEREAPRELVTRLTDLASRWTRECTSMEGLRDLVIKEQLLGMVLEEVRIWVTERKPSSSREAGELAEDYLQARSTTSGTETLKTENLPTTKCPRCGAHGHWVRDFPNQRQQRGGPLGLTKDLSGYREGMKCYACNQKGYLAANCPKPVPILQYCDYRVCPWLAARASLPRSSEWHSLQ